jgi:hypothetical protein
MIRHRVGKSLTAVSFLAFVAISFLWVRSYWVKDVIGRVWVSSDKLHIGFVQLESNNGALSVQRWWRDLSVTERARKAAERAAPEPGFYYLSGKPDPPAHFLHGFHGYFRVPMGDFDIASRVGIGHWVFVLAFSVLPEVWLRKRLRRKRRLQEGLCPMCGYDLRSTPTRCPECNYIVKA